jgi:hypothetical protein
MAPDGRGRTIGFGAPIVVGGFGGAALTYIGLVDPHRPGAIFPACPFKLLTGWNCPACGGLRMTHDLLHLDVMAAATDNIFLLLGFPTLALWLLWRWTRSQRLFPAPAVVVVAVLTAAWTIVRNLPDFPLVPTVLPHGV